MIQIKNLDFKALAEDHYNRQKPFIERVFGTRGGELIIFIKKNLHVILAGEPKLLKDDIIDKIPKSYTKKRNMKLLTSIFNYDNFIDRSKNGAYNLAKQLNIQTCPYCNRQYTFTINVKDGKTRPTFDHFYDKARYPFLALSFFNLIPSCSICNSSLKGSKHKFCINTHVHPYIDGFGNEVRFRISLLDKKYKTIKDLSTAGVDFFYGSFDSFKIELKVEKPLTDLQTRANANISAYKLEELYNGHKDYVVELIQKSRIYEKSYRDELRRNFGTLFRNDDDVLRMVLGNYIAEEDLGKRVLSKLTKDIWEEFGLDKI